MVLYESSLEQNKYFQIIFRVHKQEHQPSRKQRFWERCVWQWKNGVKALLRRQFLFGSTKRKVYAELILTSHINDSGVESFIEARILWLLDTKPGDVPGRHSFCCGQSKERVCIWQKRSGGFCQSDVHHFQAL